MTRAAYLKEVYHLEAHVEGGFFAEVYTAEEEKDARPIAGSIYFLLDRGEISHLHEIDCDEIWYYHEGCGMKITVLNGGAAEEYLLGGDAARGERAMVAIRKGSIFAAENLDPDGFTFVSCVTAPKFRYEGFRLVYKDEIRKAYGAQYEALEHLAY